MCSNILEQARTVKDLPNHPPVSEGAHLEVAFAYIYASVGDFVLFLLVSLTLARKRQNTLSQPMFYCVFFPQFSIYLQSSHVC